MAALMDIDSDDRPQDDTVEDVLTSMWRYVDNYFICGRMLCISGLAHTPTHLLAFSFSLPVCFFAILCGHVYELVTAFSVAAP